MQSEAGLKASGLQRVHLRNRTPERSGDMDRIRIQVGEEQVTRPRIYKV